MVNKNKSDSDFCGDDTEDNEMKSKDCHDVEDPICRIYWQVEKLGVNNNYLDHLLKYCILISGARIDFEC